MDLNLEALLTKLRKEKPLVHNITNYVVMNFTANTLLSMGASPVMAHAEEEVEEMVSIAKALVINIGTLSQPWIRSMLKAGKKANTVGVPVIFDPVGSGATNLRTETARKIINEVKCSIIRGNSSEIHSLISDSAKTKGVDAGDSNEDSIKISGEIAKKTGAVVAITGQVDIINDGKNVIQCINGDSLLTSVTGTGCAATATIAAFAGITENMIEAATAGLTFFGLAGEIAARKARSPGSFYVALMDALHDITPEDLKKGARLIL